MKSDIPTYVYAIRCGDWIKIGMSMDTDERLSTLRAHSPHPMTLVARRQCPNAPAAKSLERRAHQILWSQRQHGEWFVEAGPDDPVEVLLGVYDDEARRRGWETPAEQIDPRDPAYHLMREKYAAHPRRMYSTP